MIVVLEIALDDDYVDKIEEIVIDADEVDERKHDIDLNDMLQLVSLNDEKVLDELINDEDDDGGEVMHHMIVLELHDDEDLDIFDELIIELLVLIDVLLGQTDALH